MRARGTPVRAHCRENKLAKFDDDPKLVEFALCIAYRVAQRCLRRHGRIPHHDIQDLKHHAFIGIRRAWVDRKYRQSKGAVSTFMWRIAWGDLEDLREKMIRRKSRVVPDDIAASDDHDPATASFDPDTESAIFGDEQPVAEWLAEMYRRLERRYAAERYAEASRMGRPPHWRPEQRAAMTLLQARMRLSMRGMVHLLVSRPDIRDAVKMTRIPSYRFFFEISKSVTKVQTARRRMALAVA